MLYFLLFVSVMADVIKNSYWNHFGKNTINSLRDTCLFNGIVGSGGVLFFAIFGRQFVISQQSLLLAVAFALVTAGAQFFFFACIVMWSDVNKRFVYIPWRNAYSNRFRSSLSSSKSRRFSSCRIDFDDSDCIFGR